MGNGLLQLGGDWDPLRDDSGGNSWGSRGEEASEITPS